MDELINEPIAKLIETLPCEGYPEGTIGAIQYISAQHLSDLKAKVGKDVLGNEIIALRLDERNIIKGFPAFLDTGARITLSKEEKTHNIDFLIEPMSRIFAARNRYNPEELKKLEVLESTEDTSDYVLLLSFKKNPETSAYFIQTIQIQKKI